MRLRITALLLTFAGAANCLRMAAKRRPHNTKSRIVRVTGADIGRARALEGEVLIGSVASIGWSLGISARRLVEPSRPERGRGLFGILYQLDCFPSLCSTLGGATSTRSCQLERAGKGWLLTFTRWEGAGLQL